MAKIFLLSRCVEPDLETFIEELIAVSSNLEMLEQIEEWHEKYYCPIISDWTYYIEEEEILT